MLERRRKQRLKCVKGINEDYGQVHDVWKIATFMTLLLFFLFTLSLEPLIFRLSLNLPYLRKYEGIWSIKRLQVLCELRFSSVSILSASNIFSSNPSASFLFVFYLDGTMIHIFNSSKPHGQQRFRVGPTTDIDHHYWRKWGRFTTYSYFRTLFYPLRSEHAFKYIKWWVFFSLEITPLRTTFIMREQDLNWEMCK